MRTIIQLNSYMLLLWGMLWLASCAGEEQGVTPVIDEDPRPVPVALQAQTYDPSTRTSAGGEQWLITDEIGIYMLTAGQALSSAAISEDADNRKYQPQTADVSSYLVPAADDQTVYFPGSGSVDFLAYYPWKASGSGLGQINNYVYPIDLTDQSDPAALDLLYARKANLDKSTATVNLSFAHPLSKITLHIKAGADLGVVDFSDLSATLSGMPATASFALADGTIGSLGSAVDFLAFKRATALPGFEASFEALLIPQAENVYTGRKVTFFSGGVFYEWQISDASVFEAGKNYIYSLVVHTSSVDTEETATSSLGSITPWEDRDHTATGVIETVQIAGGSFWMGSSETEPHRGPHEGLHLVTLPGFHISKYEITNAQYAAFLNSRAIQGEFDGSRTIVAKFGGNNLFYEMDEKGLAWDEDQEKWIVRDASYRKHPVVYVTWHGANEYALWAKGSLPAEAQWEYACRAGRSTPFGLGDGESLYADQANFNGSQPYALPDGAISNYLGYERPNTYLMRTVPVGSYSPNDWGLYDMHGNVAEWCSDWWSENYSNPPTGTEHVVRGGHFSSSAAECRSAYRGVGSNPAAAETYGPNLGFRVVFPVP
ncbi:MAG: SUMF1/EgtB/PvdO family nonheme iron enzyme [Tannerellaceae bacterium]|jgi:formylglycine-generating enzyme required for sulfatase activity|nr:SUMF1/EgtB/PvdO family nonheme iron enzyme [Tannerellaceae bacterium]